VRHEPAAIQGGTFADAKGTVRHRGWFAGGSEELTPGDHDALARVPLALVGGALVVSPRAWTKVSSTTVKANAATPAVVRFVRGAAG
jgi:hypothetical protein